MAPMPNVLTEGVNLACVLEATLGAAVPPTTGWFNVQPNSLGDIGSSYKKLARTPISKNRMNQRPILVDEDSAVPWQSDITKDFLDNYLEGIFMSAMKHGGGTGLSKFAPTAVAATSITVPALGAMQTSMLVFLRGALLQTQSPALFVVGAGSTGTSITIAGGVVETLPANASLDVVGYQATVAADIQMDGSGNIISTVANFTTMGLNVGQWIYLPTPTGGAAFAFANTVYTGFARISAITATKLTLVRRSWVVGAADAAAGKTIRIFFSRWIRNVSIDSTDYKQPSYAFEVTYPNLGAGPVAEYEYALGNLIDTAVFNIPLTTKATCDMTFTGTVTADPTTARVTGPSIATNPVTQVAVSTATDLMRMRVSNVDETGISTDFQSIKLTLKNNVMPEKQLGTLGAKIMNVGRFEANIEAEVIFSSDQIIIGIHDNRIAAMDVALRNGDAFGCLIDISSLSIDDGNRKFESNKSVLISSKMSGYQDAVQNFVCGISMFGYLPPV